MSFFENLDNLFQDIENHHVADEWYLCHFIDENIKTLSTHQAFDILKSYVPYLITMHHFDYEVLNILFALKNQTNTNERFYTDEQRHIILTIYHQDDEIDKIRNIFY